MAQVLKARNFKQVDVLNAKVGSKPSYIWLSILCSRDLIKKGLLWRVGDGNHIQAVSDSWIPRLAASGRSSRCGLNELVMVKNLISPTRIWKEDVVRALFPSFEAEYILDIPLSRRLSEDTRFWRWEINGKYPVKSGYLLGLGCFATLESHSAHHMDKWWNLIWNLNVPQKVRIFF